MTAITEVRAVLSDDSNMILESAARTGKFAAMRDAEQRGVRDEVDEQLLPILLEEAGELYPKICLTLQAWRESSGQNALLSNQLQRSLHTFKGSARMAGAMRLGELIHRLEGRVAGAINERSFDAALWGELENYSGYIAVVLKELAGGEAASFDVTAAAQQDFAEMDMVPFAAVSERLYRVARQTAKELGKRVNLELIGGEIELDCEVLEKMTAPFEHLLRNAIAHGIETPEQRKRAGKTVIGEISLSLHKQPNGELVFQFSDDGMGLNMALLQQKALEHDMLRQGESISEAQAIQLIFKPGLSTAREVTEIAGRGIGLDVVHSEVQALGGRLDVATMPGKGLCFIIRLPAH